MILYLDTSALMKLYALEQHSDWTRHQVQQADLCIVSQITWTEMCAGLAMKTRTQQITSQSMTSALERLRAEWGGYTRLAVDSALVSRAGELALTFALRAYDSVQLASAQGAQQSAGTGLRFCCFDKSLNTAARALRLTTLQPG